MHVMSPSQVLTRSVEMRGDPGCERTLLTNSQLHVNLTSIVWWLGLCLLFRHKVSATDFTVDLPFFFASTDENNHS